MDYLKADDSVVIDAISKDPQVNDVELHLMVIILENFSEFIAPAVVEVKEIMQQVVEELAQLAGFESDTAMRAEVQNICQLLGDLEDLEILKGCGAGQELLTELITMDIWSLEYFLKKFASVLGKYFKEPLSEEHDFSHAELDIREMFRKHGYPAWRQQFRTDFLEFAQDITKLVDQYLCSISAVDKKRLGGLLELYTKFTEEQDGKQKLLLFSRLVDGNY